MDRNPSLIDETAHARRRSEPVATRGLPRVPHAASVADAGRARSRRRLAVRQVRRAVGCPPPGDRRGVQAWVAEREKPAVAGGAL